MTTTEPATVDLLPCPFCDKKIIPHYDEDSVVFRGHSKKCIFVLMEPACNGWLRCDEEERFARKWNRRAIDRGGDYRALNSHDAFKVADEYEQHPFGDDEIQRLLVAMQSIGAVIPVEAALGQTQGDEHE